MEQAALSLMHAGEESWWYRGRRAAVSALLARFRTRLPPPERARLLDVGAGYGAMAACLQSFGAVEGYEPDPRLQDPLRDAGYAASYRTWPEVDAAGRSYDAVCAFDVIEHAEDDVALLSRMSQSLADGGLVVVSVPAYQWLWSSHDVANHHYRRYTRRTLRRSLAAAGLRPLYLGYWNCLLLPLAAAARLSGHSGGSSFSQSGALDAAFGAIAVSEGRFLRVGRLPFGLTVLAVAEKSER